MNRHSPKSQRSVAGRATAAFAVALVAACSSSNSTTSAGDSGVDAPQGQPDSGHSSSSRSSVTSSSSSQSSSQTSSSDAGLPADAGAGDVVVPADTGTKDVGVDSPAPTCTDGVKNGNETGVDCGGGTCPACADQSGCKVTSDCLSGVCTSDVCAPPACAPACPDTNPCGASGDCASGVCTMGACGAPACSPTCATGAACALASDCASGVCDATTHTCDAASCTDGVKNGDETDVDCGGGTCPACADTKACSATTDCESGVCTTNVCAPPACAPACPDGNVCGAGTDCGSAVCTAGTCATPTCSPTCTPGAACGGNADCASLDCAAGACVVPVSCQALLTANPGLASGAYTIQPVGAAAPFTAYCDMTDNGGGWTLVLKIAGANVDQATQNFTYASALWTNTTLLDPTSTDLTQNEAKLQSYLSVPFTNILGMMTGADATHTLVIPASDATSMQDLIANTPTDTMVTNLGRAAWVGFTDPAATVQTNCNMDGINLIPVTGAACVGSQLSNSARVRIGILMNQEDDCCSPDSYVGFGGDYYYNPDCDGEWSPAAGSLGGDCYGGGASVYDFGYLFVR